MNTQNESTSVAVIAAPEDEQTALYVADGLQQRGKDAKLYFLRDQLLPAIHEERQLIVLASQHLVRQYGEDISSLSPHNFAQAIILDTDDTWLKVSHIGLNHLPHVIDFTYREQWYSRIHELSRHIDKTVTAKRQAVSTVDEQQTESVQSGSLSQSIPNDYICVFTDDRGITVEKYIITPDLASLLLKAQKLHETYKSTRTEEPDIAFTSLLFAMLIPDTTIARWFDAFIRRTEVDIETGLRAINQDTASLQGWQISLPISGSIELWPSMSVLFMFSEAQSLASNTLLDVRHIMAACIYSTNSGLENKLADWNFNRVKWSNSFLGFVAKAYPDEADMYGNLHASVFSAQPEPVDADVPHEAPLRGPSTHIDSDRWTTDDALGYDAYAHAIYRFLVHEKTQPPLTISIQAPWGGGKTSLMRMIQKELDPEAVPEQISALHQEENQSGRLTVRKVLEEIRTWTSGEQLHQPKVEEDNKRQRLTVWFNAWKYESVNQVWAGLADAIMQQISSRMPVAERELFWLQLQRKRVDVDKIRQKIHDLIVRRVWRFAVKVLPAVAGAMATGVVAIAGGWTSLGWIVTGSTVPIGMTAIIWQYFSAKKKVEDEPADISLGEYVKAPDYSAELGFIHHAERDLQRVFECIPEKYKPLIVFIDDLDRCSPGNVAKVMEAVNLFLAGEFPNCVFVLGMDSELVAAALQAAHSDMIAALDNRTKTPVGWRFMDKFIQLPFIIPPCESDGIDRYTTTLFSSHHRQTKQADVQPVQDEETGATATVPTGQQSCGPSRRAV